MIKYLKASFCFLILFLAFSSSYLKAEENENYKIKKEKDYLSCFIPKAIKGIDTIYLKNDSGHVVYTIEIWGAEGDCDWRKDKLMFKESLSPAEINEIVKNYKHKIHFNGNFKLVFKVKKLLASEELSIDKLMVPYFILLNDKEKNEIIFKKDMSISIPLPKRGERIIRGENVHLKTSLEASNFINTETLSGIYFKPKN